MANYYVATNGNDNNPGTIGEPFATIQKGIDTAVAGDTVYVRGGTYSVSSRIKFNNSGTVGTPIVLRNYPGETPVVDGVNADWGYDWSSLIRFNAQNNITVDGLRVINSRWAGIGDHSDANGSEGIIVINCSTYNTQSSGIAFFYGKDITIEDNSVELACVNTGGSQECISLAGVDGFYVLGNQIFNITNDVGGGGGEGIDVKAGCKNGVIANNTVHDILKHPIYIDAHDQEQYNIEVYENTVYNAPTVVTVATEETGGNLHDILIRDNIGYDCEWGFVIGGWDVDSVRTMSAITFRDNVLTDIEEFAFFIGNPDATNITIKNNYLGCDPDFPSIYVDPSHPDGLIDISTYTIDGNAIIGVFAGYPTGINYKLITNIAVDTKRRVALAAAVSVDTERRTIVDAIVNVDTRRWLQKIIMLGRVSLLAEFKLDRDLLAEFKLEIGLDAEFDIAESLEGDVNVTMENQDFNLIPGDDKTLNFTITLPDGILLADATAIIFSLGKGLLTKTLTNGITVTGDNTFSVELPHIDTSGLDKDYKYTVRIINALGQTATVARGTCKIV